MKPKTGFYRNTVVAALAALSFILQVIHVGVASTWGMWIDFVAVPWMIAFFLLGVEAAFTTSIIMLILISLVAASGVIGAVMKFIATIPMFLVPAMLLFKRKKLMASISILVIFTASLGIVFSHDILNYQQPEGGSQTLQKLPLTENLKLKMDFAGFTLAERLTASMAAAVEIKPSITTGI